MMQRCGTLSADTESVEKTSYSDIDTSTLKLFLFSKYRKELEDNGIFATSLQTIEVENMVLAIDKNLTIEQLLKNILILDDKGQLTLTGLLLLSKNIQHHRPVFTIKCISFVGNSLGGMQFRDKLSDNLMEGNLLTQYNAAISFITRNLKTVQVEKEFNTLGELEIPLAVFIETITNALIHRDYYIGAPIRLFIFDDRIELHSPGILPGTVTEENITNGISVPRNKLLFNNAKFLLPYTGAGSGMMRVVENYNKISFSNNLETQEFVITMMRDDVLKNEGIKNIVNKGFDELHEGINLNFEGINEGIKEDLLKIYLHLQKNEESKLSDIKKIINKSDATVERYFKILKDYDLIKYVGSKKTGGYSIKN
jgi:predicted HTH transcriptional regulator